MATKVEVMVRRYAKAKEAQKKLEAEISTLQAFLKPLVVSNGGKLETSKVLLTIQDRKGSTTFDLKAATAEIPGFAEHFAKFIRQGSPVQALTYSVKL